MESFSYEYNNLHLMLQESFISLTLNMMIINLGLSPVDAFLVIYQAKPLPTYLEGNYQKIWNM